MSRMAYLIPKSGLTIRDPQTLAQLPAEGAQVAINAYWTRRMQAGDVREGTPSPDTTPAADKSATKSSVKE